VAGAGPAGPRIDAGAENGDRGAQLHAVAGHGPVGDAPSAPLAQSVDDGVPGSGATAGGVPVRRCRHHSSLGHVGHHHAHVLARAQRTVGRRVQQAAGGRP
jgi:hypothetical protein